MKRILFILFALFSFITINAQTYNYRAKEFAYKYVNDYGKWTSWSDWYESNVKITINYSEDVIVIHTDTPQIYVVYKYNGTKKDDKGGVQAEFLVIDQDYDKGAVRLRIEDNGNSQIYIDFADVMWVYSGLIKL